MQHFLEKIKTKKIKECSGRRLYQYNEDDFLLIML